jgi:hypothetical protein
MIKIFITAIMMVLGMTHLSNAQFTGKIVARGKLGSRPGEFGYYGEGFGAGPSNVVVSRKGNIYIADDVNDRIVVYRGGKYVRCFKSKIGSMAIDSKEKLFISNGDETIVMDSLGVEIDRIGRGGIIHIVLDTLYLMKDDTSYVCIYDNKSNALKEIRKIYDTGVGVTMMSKGIRYVLTRKSIIKSGLAMLRIDGKEVIIKKKSKGKTFDIKANEIFNFKRSILIEGDDSGNVYLCSSTDYARVNSKGELTGVIKLTNEDLNYIEVPYVPGDFSRIQNGKLYYIGFLRDKIHDKKGKFIRYDDREVLIIEYEFKPVE